MSAAFAYPDQAFIEEAISEGRVVCDIGQITPAMRRKLDNRARKGEIAKWRGYWHPIAGASIGIGPVKTCFGLPAARAAVF